MAGMMTKVAFASKIAILMKTTSDDPNPTAGYLYGEVSKISYESVEYCEHMVDFLLSRLKKKSLNVKLKTLLVMRNVVEKGSIEFTRSLRKQSIGIKEMKTFSGPPDPLLGDSLYVQIRKTASEILEILFDTDRNTPASSTSGNASQMSSPSMEGFGVSATPDTDDSGIFKSIIGKIKETVPQIKTASEYMFPAQTSNNNNIDTSTKINQDYQCFGRSENPVSNLPSNYITNMFGGASHVEKDYKTDSINSHGISEQNSNWLVKTSTDTPISQPRKYQIDLHENEKRIVEEIVTPQGIRSQPTTQDTYTFLQKCQTLDREIIVKLLSENLSHQDTRVQLRTMFILESLLQSKLSNIREVVQDNCETLLNTFSTSSHIATRDKAKKLLQLMRNEVVQVEPVPAIFENQLEQPKIPKKQHEDMFGGLQVHEKSSNTQVNPLDAFLSSSTENNTNLFNTQTFDNTVNKQTSKQTDLFDFDLDPFSSSSQVGSTNSSSSSCLNPGVNTLPINKITTLVPTMNTNKNNTGLVLQTSTGSAPLDSSFGKELNFSSIEKPSENKCATSNFIADFSNMQASESNGFSSKQRSTVGEASNNFGNVNKNNQYISPSSTTSLDLFGELQTNPSVFMNTSNSSNNQLLSSNKSTIPTTKDMFFQTTNSDSFDPLSPQLNNLSMNVSSQPRTQPVNQFQQLPAQNNFSGFSNNMMGPLTPQNMCQVGMNRPPPVQMNNNPHHFSQTFQSQRPLSNTCQFQNIPGPNAMRYHSPVRMQAYPGFNTPNNNFNFLSQKSAEGKSSNDSFDFVQDAMKASKKQ